MSAERAIDMALRGAKQDNGVTNIVSSLINGILLNPVEAAGVVAAWVIMIGLGLGTSRLRSRPSWRFGPIDAEVASPLEPT